MVAYWEVPTSTETNFDKIFAYTSTKETESLITIIEPGSFPKLTPYFIDPDSLPTPGKPAPASKQQSFVEQHTAQLMVETLLVDPYTALHVYSGILPISSIQLPSWAIQQGLKNMGRSLSLSWWLLDSITR